MGGTEQAWGSQEERQEFSKEVLTLLKILVDIHSVLNNNHVQLSIVYMRNLLTSTCTLLESYRYISDKRVALSSRVVTHRYKWLVWPVCRFLLSMNDLFQDGQITPPQSYDQLGLDERRWHSVKVYRGSLMFIIKSSRQLLTTICGVVGSNKLCTRSIRCEVLQHQAHVMSFHATVRCPAHTDVQRREVRIT